MEFSAADNVRYAIEEEGWTEIYEDRDLWVFKKMGARPESQDKIKLEVDRVLRTDHTLDFRNLIVTQAAGDEVFVYPVSNL